MTPVNIISGVIAIPGILIVIFNRQIFHISEPLSASFIHHDPDDEDLAPYRPTKKGGHIPITVIVGCGWTIGFLMMLFAE